MGRNGSQERRLGLNQEQQRPGGRGASGKWDMSGVREQEWMKGRFEDGKKRDEKGLYFTGEASFHTGNHIIGCQDLATSLARGEEQRPKWVPEPGRQEMRRRTHKAPVLY